MTEPDTTAAAPAFRQRLSSYLEARPRLRRELYFVGGALAVGLILMPILIYLAGSLTLGPYASGGFGSFLGDFFGGLFRGWLPVWGVVLGPYALIMLLRLVRLILKTYLAPTQARSEDA